MALTQDKIALLLPESSTDFDTGGGRATATALPENQIGALWPQVSRVDRAAGRDNLRKLFAAVRSADTQILAGAGMLLMRPPADPLVSLVMFSTGTTAVAAADLRTAARNYIESYVVAGPPSSWWLYGTHVAGVQALTLLTRVGATPPRIGDVLLLISGSTTQYVRVRAVTVETRTYSDAQGEFKNDYIAVTIASRLSTDFVGGSPSRYSTPNGTATVNTTTPAAAARYYGISPLAEAANDGDLTVRVASIFAPIVPSATAQTAVVDATAGGAQPMVTARASVMTLASASLLQAPNATVALYGSRGCTPGSATLTGGGGSFRWLDNGAGKLVPDPSQPYTGSASLTIDYASATVTGTMQVSFGYGTAALTLTGIPAAPAGQSARTLSYPVTLGSRTNVLAPLLDPLPAPATLTVSYRARGRWSTLRDAGAGVLVPDTAGAGAGTINYTTGSVSITLGELPDVGTAVLLAWGSGDDYVQRAGDVAIKPATIRYTTAQGSLQPGSVVVTWYQGGAAKSVTDNGSGAFSNANGTGSVDYRTGEILVWPAAAPDVGSVVTVAYQTSAPATGSHAVSAAGSTLSGTLTGSLRAGTVRIAVPVSAWIVFTKNGYPDKKLEITDTLVVTDNGSGGLVGAEGISSGTINYSTGAYSITLAGTITRNVYGHTHWGNYALTLAAGSGNVLWQASVTTTAYAPTTETLSGGLTALAFDLTPATTQAVLPGSVLFTWGGLTYVDRSGSLYHSISASTGAGTLAGAIDYATGIATLTSWTPGAGNTISVLALLAVRGAWDTVETRARLPGSPAVPGSVTVRATRPDGTLITATADGTGAFPGGTSGVRGTVDYDSGILSLEWGADSGSGWQALGVIASTVRLNCVVTASLPMDAELIGVDPTRLPADGRVAIFEAGGTNLVLVHETSTETLPSGLTAGQVVTLAVDDLQALELRDQNGVQVDYALWSGDLVAGTVTMATPLNLSAYTQPLVAHRTVGDLLAISDVQVDGTITLAGQLSRAYTTAAYASSMLRFGDLQARLSVLFDQASWDSVTFIDSVSGSVATGTYNTTGNVTLTNRDAITERWALKFTSATQFVVIGETLGQLSGTYSTSADCAPVNPYTGQPYFTLKASGFGSGWATGNAIRFNTVGAQAAAWLARCIRTGAQALASDYGRVLVYGDG